MSAEAAPLRDVVIIGGGCYGSFYARQLEAACRKGRLVLRRVLVVDRDPACLAARELEAFPGREIVVGEWEAYLRQFLSADAPAAGAPDDAIVPSPLMPHLMATWLLDLARERWPGRHIALTTPHAALGTPYDALGPDGTRYVSFADWICPTHCVEPLTCPMIRAPRTWEMGDALRDYVGRLNVATPTRGPALFTTRHYAFGVGMFGAAEIRESRGVMLEAGNEGPETDLIVGTVSACHGALSVLRLGNSSPGD